MSKKLELPKKLLELLDATEPNPELVKTNSLSKALITVETGYYHLDQEQCEKLLASSKTVRDMFRAIGAPGDPVIELYDTVLDCDAMEELEALFDVQEL
jgi:hypothetical protein